MPKKYLSDIELGSGVRIDASNLQVRGRPVSYDILRDPDDMERAIVFADGAVDSVRRNTDGLVSVLYRGEDVILITYYPSGVAAAQEVVVNLPDTHENVDIGRGTLYSDDAARVIPSHNPDNLTYWVGERRLSDGEFIKACLDAGFTEHQKTGSTHRFHYFLDTHPTEKRLQVMRVDAMGVI